ncbi:sensor histidine kinase [Paenibacillus sp. GP183]|uniref:cache domain-containing sensor histidine kinase n=1 Tax=Paenibacillus sp. GP183 TaxID=1882751 RepID=UPI00089A1FD5|nr:sensor histidine kinase [Paenibacillus sp. GP183]SEC81267.1 two-component system, sensor histidine kinase YesM [Paenibacillus sp. GP183]
MRSRGQPSFPLFPLKSIQSNISTAFSLLILLAIASTSLISYRLSEDAVVRNSKVYVGEVINQVNENIQSYVDTMENISMFALTNKDVKYYISRNTFLSEEELRPYQKRISDLFQSIQYTRKDIASIMVFGYNGRFVSDRRITSLNPYTKPEEQSWYLKAKSEGGKSVISRPHVQNIIQNEYRWVVSLSRELKSTDGIRGEGILLVDLNMSVINEICSKINLGKRGYVFIVDQNGDIVYHPQQELIYGHLRSELIDRVTSAGNGSFIADDENGKRIYTINNTNFGWKIVGVAYTDELIADPSTMQNSFLLTGIIGLAVTLVISFLIARSLSRPIKKLQGNMKHVESGNFDVLAEINQRDEIGQLSRTFNLMIGQIKKLLQQIIETEKTKRTTELRLLQAQINPHFLYNTLDSIIWMAEQKQHEEVVTMTSALAKLFRASITKENELVPLQVEIDHIDNYLLIQKMRYQEQLDYRIEVPEELMQVKTLKLLLQPFVENAIYHGIKNKPEIGLIVISAREEGDNLVFEIVDNGLGMTAEKLQSILKHQEREARGGVGVLNVNERIQLFFGQEYGVHFESELEVGTRVTIVVPKR